MTGGGSGSTITLRPGVDLCQADLPLDWYQAEFRPYAEEYLALADRRPETVLPWLDRYARPAVEHFGDSLLLLAHFYMGGEIVKLIERYGGSIGDSYALALCGQRSPGASVIVQSAVHFMAETVAILAEPHQRVWITNPKAGCTMEMMAKERDVSPVAERLIERYADDLAIVAYMNTSGRIKALAGRHHGATCTSSNAHLVLDWARRRARKVLFIPDRYLGENAAARIGIPRDRIYTIRPSPALHGSIRPGPTEIDRDAADRAELILWGGYCGVHTVFRADQVHAWRKRGYTVLVHPECTPDVVRAADGRGSTKTLWKTVMEAGPGSRFAVGTEGHFVRNLREQAAPRGIAVEHLAAAPGAESPRSAGCACATMSRNDPPHLAGMLDLLRRGEPPDINHVLPGDAIDEATCARERLPPCERAETAAAARVALERMIEIVESHARPAGGADPA